MANIVWGINNVGWNADNLTVVDGAVASGYSANDIITGPRSTSFKTDADTGDTLEIDYRVTNYSTAPTKFLEASHVFISRWDKFTNHQYASDELRAKFSVYNNSAYTTLLDYDQVGDTTWSLMGPTAQDYCFTLNSGSTIIGAAFQFAALHGSGSTSWAVELGKLYFSKPWNPGRGPDLDSQPNWSSLGTDAVYTPPRGDLQLNVEAAITLTWKALSNAVRDDLATYGGDDCLLNWPFFLYDEDKSLWPHQLEHVVLVDYAWSKRADGNNDLSCRFYRLRHYS